MLNDARVASRGFFKDNMCTTRIHKEKKFKIKFQVLLKFAQIPPDYYAQYVFQPLKKFNRLEFMLGNSSSPSALYVPVAPRIASIVCPSESNIDSKLVQVYVHTSHYLL